MEPPPAVPPWLPPLLCVLCSACAGLTSFGDAILLQVLWALATVGGLLPPGRGSLIAATAFATLQSAANLLPMLAQSRAQLRTALPYGVLMGACGAAAVPLGARLLFAGDLGAVKLGIGLTFAAFSVARLTLAARRAGLQRRDVSAGRHLPLADESPPPPAGPATAPPAPSASPPPPLTPPASAVAPDGGALEPPAWVPAPLRPWLTLGRVATASGPVTAAVLSAAGLVAGLLGALFGTGGPPQMIAFSLLSVEKDYIRAISAVYSVVDLTARLAAFGAQQQGSGGGPFRRDDAGVYVAVVVCSWAGFAAGSLARARANTDAIINLLLALVYASSAILLGALDSDALAGGFCALTGAWACVLAALLLRPSWFDGALHCCGAGRSAGHSRSSGKGSGGSGSNGSGSGSSGSGSSTANGAAASAHAPPCSADVIS